MAIKDRSEARQAGVISGVWTALVFWGSITVGLLVRAMYEAGAEWAQPLGTGTQSEAGLVVAALYLLPSVLAGMVLAAVLSAICSTADSQLVVAASAAANDLYSRLFERSGKMAHMLVNRAVVLGLGVGAVLLVINERISIYKYVLTYAWAMLGASFVAMLVPTLLGNAPIYDSLRPQNLARGGISDK